MRWRSARARWADLALAGHRRGRRIYRCESGRDGARVPGRRRDALVGGLRAALRNRTIRRPRGGDDDPRGRRLPRRRRLRRLIRAGPPRDCPLDEGGSLTPRRGAHPTAGVLQKTPLLTRHSAPSHDGVPRSLTYFRARRYGARPTTRSSLRRPPLLRFRDRRLVQRKFGQPRFGARCRLTFWR